MTFNTTLNPRSGKRQRLAVSTTAVGFTASNYLFEFASTNDTAEPRVDTPKGAVLQVGVDSIYYTLDGTTPSASVGFLATAGDYIFLDSYQKVKEFRAIRVTLDTSIEALFLYGN